MDQINSYNRAIRLNNEGVEFIESCQYDRAITILLSATQVIKEELASDKRSNRDPCSRNHHCQNGVSSSTTPEEMVDQCALHTTDCDFRETALPQFLDNRHSSSSCSATSRPRFVFRFPINARPSETPCFVKLSIIALYNLALSFHLSAIESSNKAMLSKALMLYECTYQVQVEEQVELCFVHPLAIINNVGHIHALLNHHDQAALSFGHLLSIMLCFIDQSIGCTDEAAETWDGFMSNVFELMLKTPSPAAAA